MDIIVKASQAIDALGPMNVANRFDRDMVIRAVLETLLEPTDVMAREAEFTSSDISAPETRKEIFKAMVAVALR